MRPRTWLALLFVPLLLTAQQPPRTIAVTEPSLMVRDRAGRLEPIRLTRLQARAEVVGSLATTTLEFTFFNPQNRVLEGELVFPLGMGQRVSRFGLDLNGRIREAVVVDKAKGRQIFEDIVRRGVDPGLLEQVEGNAYKARVYPIPARGTRRILIAFEQTLPRTPEGQLYTLTMPTRQPLEQLDLEVTVHKQEAAPSVRKGGLANLTFARWEEAYRAQTSLKDVQPGEPLQVEIPHAATPRVHMYREGGRAWFCTDVEVSAPAEPRPTPSGIALLWDVSASSAKRDFAREWALLEGYLRRHPTAHLDVAAFSCAIHTTRAFPPSEGRLAALRAFLAAQAPDGGTQLGALDLSRFQADEILLSTDGISTFGASEPKLPPGPVPVQVITSAPGADDAVLRHLAHATGGQVLDLLRLTTDEALAALARRPLQFLGVEGDGVEDVHPKGPIPVQGGFTLAGILTKPGTDLTLRFGYGGRATQTRSLHVDAVDGTPMARRIWAMQKLADLELQPLKHAAAIRTHAVAHGLVCRQTSLLVLETLEDYLRYEIVPPPELRAAYDAARNNARTQEKQVRRDHLEDVVRAYQERLRWWETVVEPAKLTPKHREHVDLSTRYAVAAGSTSGGVAGGGVAGTGMTVAADRSSAPPPPPPPPPPRPMAVAMDLVPEVAPREVPRADHARAFTESEEAKRKAVSSSPRIEGRMSVAAWSSDAPYLKALRNAAADQRDATYLALKAEHGRSSGFYLDAADVFASKGAPEKALRVLSNLAELESEDPALLRILGHRLVQLKRLPLARIIFEKVLSLREEEPQSYRDLALILADLGQHQRAVDLLWKVVSRPWDGRFPGIEVIACEELNAILGRAKRPLDTRVLDARLLKAMPVDLRVVLTWDTDACDVDLQVTDPRGETCHYGNPRTALAGLISSDFTGGYGPEEFLLRRAIPGPYQVRAHYFGDRSQKVGGPTTLMVTFFTNFGRPDEKRQSTILRLTNPRDLIDVGTFTFEAPGR